MGCRLTVSADHERRLRELNPHLRFQWNNRLSRWEVWFRSPTKRPYMIAPVVNDDNSFRPIDARIFSHMRKMLWINRDIVRRMRAKAMEEYYTDQKRDRDEEDLMLDIGKELYRPAQMLEREVGISHGKSKIPYSYGYGDGVGTVRL